MLKFRKYYIFFLVIIPFLYSCGTVSNVSNKITTTIKAKYYIRSISNEFDAYSIRELTRNVLIMDDLFPDEFIELNLRQFITEKKQEIYSLILVYRGEKGLQVEAKEPMILLVDDERFTPEKVFQDQNFTKQREFRDRLIEEETFSTNVEIIKKIAYAKNVKIKLNGKKQSIVCKFSPTNIEGFREFYEKHIVTIKK